MAAEHSLRDLLHGATHRIPGVPAHVEHPPGHQGSANVGAERRPAAPRPAAQRAPHSAHGRSWNHSAARPPRVLAGWQHRIARFFGQEV